MPLGLFAENTMAHDPNPDAATSAATIATAAIAATQAATAGVADAPLEQPIVVDGMGLECPEPLMLLRKCVREAKEGQLIALLSEDPVSLRDVPAYCEFMHHTLVSMPSPEHPHRYLIRKGSDTSAS